MRHSQNGFTMVELMVVVAVIGVLATIAIFMFSKTSNKARVSSEVPAMITEFKLKQERFYLENSAYLGQADETAWFPATPAGTDQPNPLASPPAEWVSLRIETGKSTAWCRYVFVAGAAGDATNLGAIANAFGLTVAPTTDWFYVIAECDTDGKGGTNALYFATSNSEEIFEQNVGR